MTSEGVIRIRYGTLIVAASIVSSALTYAFTYGYNLRDRKAQAENDLYLQKQIDELKIEHKRYTDLEVGGLRSDWERELNHNKK